MKKVLALTKDGRMTYCSAPEELRGKGRCNHVNHQEKNETPQEFMERTARKDIYSNSRKSLSQMFRSKIKLLGGITTIGLMTLTLAGCSGETLGERANRLHMDKVEQKLKQAESGSYKSSNSKSASNSESSNSSTPTKGETTVTNEKTGKGVTVPTNPNFSIGYDSSTKSYTKKELDKLIDKIPTHARQDISYDRDSWGTNTPSFAYTFEGKEYKTPSTRKAGLYKGSWYNEKTGEYTDPYTGNVITDLTRSYGPSGLQFDHLLPLSYVASQVGDSWNQEKKNAYAYDLNIGVDASSSLNGAKSDKGPSEFLPKENKVQYVVSWVKIASDYGIPLAKEDKVVIQDLIDNAQPDELKIINTYNK